MFFWLDISFILNELESKKELWDYFKISEIFTVDYVYKIFSQQNPENILKVLNRILNHKNRVKRREKRHLLLMQHQLTWILILTEIKR